MIVIETNHKTNRMKFLQIIAAAAALSQTSAVDLGERPSFHEFKDVIKEHTRFDEAAIG